MSRRTLRLSELLRDEISLLIQRKVRDPRLNHLVSITSVSVSSDLREAQVYVSTLGTEEEKAEVFKGLKAAGPFLRRNLAPRLSLRFTPNLTFHRDDSIEKGARVLNLINQLSASENILSSSQQP